VAQREHGVLRGIPRQKVRFLDIYQVTVMV
jgi:hypothetical protein